RAASLHAADIQVTATNTADKPELLDGQGNQTDNVKTFAGGLVAGGGSTSDMEIWLKTHATVAPSAVVAVVGTISDEHHLLIAATNVINAFEKDTFHSAGLGSGISADSTIATQLEEALVEI